MATKQNARGSAGAGAGAGRQAGARSLSEVDPGASPVDHEIGSEDLEALDSDFEDLFGDGSENVIVELIRTDPRFFGGRRTGGFLCHLPPGSTKETIRESYGGGQYRVVKKGAGGRIVAQKSVQIAGEPLLPNPAPSSSAASHARESEAAPSGLAPVQTSAGIPIGVNNAEFLAMAQQLALVRSMFPDINAEIMKAMLNRPPAQQQDLVGLAGQIIGLVNQFRELTPPVTDSGSGGAGWLEVLREGIAAFGAYMKAQQSRPLVIPRAPGGSDPGRSPELPTAPRPALPMNPPAIPADNNSGKESEEVQSIQSYVDKAAAIINGGYLLKKSPEEVAQALELSIPLAPPVRSLMLKSQQAALRDYCEISLSDDFIEVPELKDGFGSFFDSVFNLFVK